MTTTMRAAGFTTEQTECDSCGRMELRGTVIVVNEDGEHVANYGTTCATKTLGQKISRADALSLEARRRAEVMRELQLAVRAWKSGDLAAAAMYVAGARQVGLIRADELALVARIG